MVRTFWVWDMKEAGLFGSIFGLGVVLFVYNLARTLARIPRWNVVAAAIASALIWLVLTLSAGLFLASTKCWPIALFAPLAQMHAHAHLGVLGFFVVMLVGVSYKLIPMFTLSELQNPRRAAWSIALLNIGLAGTFPSILLQSGFKLVFAGLAGAGLILYGLELRAILRARKRIALDWGVKSFLTAVGLLLPTWGLGLVLSWRSLPLTSFTGQFENLYGLLALVGVLTFAILGMLYKIVPFLVWYSRYSKEIGRHKVPSLAELYSERLQIWGYALFVAGLLTTSVSTVLANPSAVRWSCSALALSLVLFCWNMGRILSHVYRPRLAPLTLPRPSTSPTPA
jgi:hypothetical protein